jgi:cGMP-specific 3',5'-cyclic phosphodiesterase, invertebrate
LSFQALSPDDFKTVMKVVETAILSTDLAMYFKKRNTFLELIDNGEFDWQSEEKKEGCLNNILRKKTKLFGF